MNAKSGDWGRYDVALSVDGNTVLKGTQLIEVVSNDHKKVKLRISNPTGTGLPGNRPLGPPGFGVPGLLRQQQEIEIDLSNSNFPEKILAWLNQCPFTVNDKKLVNIVKDGGSSEVLSVADKTFNCAVTPLTITLNGPDDETCMITCKIWTSKTAPIGGLVKMELDVGCKCYRQEKHYEVHIHCNACHLQQQVRKASA